MAQIDNALKQFLNSEKHRTDKYINITEKTKGQYEVMKNLAPNYDLKNVALTKIDLLEESAERARKDTELLEIMTYMFEKTFEDIGALKQGIESIGIENKNISLLVEKVQSWQDERAPILNHLNEHIQARIKESEEVEKRNKKWREENK